MRGCLPLVLVDYYTSLFTFYLQKKRRGGREIGGGRKSELVDARDVVQEENIFPACSRP